MAHQEYRQDDKLPSLKRWNGDEYRDSEQFHTNLEHLYWPVTAWLITVVNLIFCGVAIWSSNGYDWAKHSASIAVFCLSLLSVAVTYSFFIKKKDYRDVRYDD